MSIRLCKTSLTLSFRQWTKPLKVIWNARWSQVSLRLLRKIACKYAFVTSGRKILGNLHLKEVLIIIYTTSFVGKKEQRSYYNMLDY